MSPATVNGKSTGIEGDLWAMGVVMYQCITGKVTEHHLFSYFCLFFQYSIIFINFFQSFYGINFILSHDFNHNLSSIS